MKHYTVLLLSATNTQTRDRVAELEMTIDRDQIGKGKVQLQSFINSTISFYSSLDKELEWTLDDSFDIHDNESIFLEAADV